MVMNEELQEFARKKLKEGLAKCTEGEQRLFKQMYYYPNLEAPIGEAVDAIPEDKLSWAMKQVENTLKKKGG